LGEEAQTAIRRKICAKFFHATALGVKRSHRVRRGREFGGSRRGREPVRGAVAGKTKRARVHAMNIAYPLPVYQG
jgi:hypothetical protein